MLHNTVIYIGLEHGDEVLISLDITDTHALGYSDYKIAWFSFGDIQLCFVSGSNGPLFFLSSLKPNVSGHVLDD